MSFSNLIRISETKIDAIIDKENVISDIKVINNFFKNILYKRKDKITILVYKNDGEVNFNTIVYNGKKIIFTIDKREKGKDLKITYVGDRVIKETTREDIYYKLYRDMKFIKNIVTYKQ